MTVSTTNSGSVARGYTIAVISAVILSTTAIFIRYLTLEYPIPPLALSFWRDAIVALTLLVILGVFRPALLPVKKSNLISLIVHGFVLGTFNALWVFSVVLNGAAISTVLVYISAVFTALLDRWLHNEPLNWAKSLAIVLSLTGCVLVSGAADPVAWSTNLGGIITGILSGLFYAIYTMMGHSGIRRGMNAWTIMVYTFGFAGLLLLFINLLPGDIFYTVSFPANIMALGNEMTGWIILFLLSAGPTLAGYGLYNVSLGYLPSSVVNLITTSEPVFTALIAYIILGERLNIEQILGSLLILAGVVILRIYKGRLANRKRPNLEVVR